MSQLVLYAKKESKWVSVLPVLKDRIDFKTNAAAFFSENYMASGSFGNVFYKLINIYDAKIMLIEMELCKEFRICGHSDMNMAMIAFCMKGTFLFHSANSAVLPVVQSQYKLDYSLSKRNYEVILKANSKKSYQLLILTLKVPEKIKKYIDKIDSYILQSRSFTNNIEMQVLLSGFISEARKINPLEGSLRAYMHLMLMLSIDIVQNWQFPQQSTQIESRNKEKVAYKIAESIILDLEESWTLKKLAASEKTSITNIKWLFKKYIGFPVTTFRIAVRLQKAKQLLVERNLSIQEISITVGYANPGQFSSMFKRKIGCSPSEFRKNENFIRD